MDLYIVRHAVAHDRDLDRWPTDESRPLTDEGVERFTSVAKGLATLATRPDRLLASPLVRAVQTAKILTDTIGWPEVEIDPLLEPGARVEKIIGLLAAHPEDARVAIVGHEPDLGSLVSQLTAGAGTPSFVPMKKGGVARVVCDGVPSSGTGDLKWLSTPGILESLA